MEGAPSSPIFEGHNNSPGCTMRGACRLDGVQQRRLVYILFHFEIHEFLDYTFVRKGDF